MSGKEPLGKLAHDWLKKYLDSEYQEIPSSFSHIAEWFSSGVLHRHMRVTCFSFGYTLDELKTAKSHGKTSRDIGQEILSRGYIIYREAGQWDIVPYDASS